LLSSISYYCYQESYRYKHNESFVINKKESISPIIMGVYTRYHCKCYRVIARAEVGKAIITKK